MKHLARLLRVSEGHAYTVVLAVLAAGALVVLGVPPLIDDGGAPAGPPAVTTTTIAVPRFGEGSATTEP